MSVNLKKSYANLNEKLIAQNDQSGVRRSFTVPYIDGQATDEHINAVAAAAAQSGGLTGNLVMSSHHSDGKGWGSGDGHTVGHSADKLRGTLIPKDDEHAKATIAAAQKHLNNLKTLLGDKDPDLQASQSQLDLVKKRDGAGMNLLDFGVILTQIMYKPTQAVARLHDATKEGGMHPQLRPPAGGGAAPTDQSGAPGGQEQPDASQAQAPPPAGASPEAQAAPEAPAAPAAAAAPQQA